MLNRCIMIFPEIVNVDVIERIREKYDPNYKLVRPHITLVFPFESDIGADELKDHVQNALQGIEPFPVSLQGVTEQRGFDNYMLLNVHQGKNTLKEMHCRLYTGMLERFRPRWSRTFEPHMTVGRIADPALFAAALDETRAMCELFCTCVDTVFVEIIGADGDSSIESAIRLATPAL
jgi:2'-5' RNA ligase